MSDDLQAELLRWVWVAGLPSEEPIVEWRETPALHQLVLGSDDDDGQPVLVMDGACEYRVNRDTGCVDVTDRRNPRMMRFQRYDPERPGQPYLDTAHQGP